MNDDLQLSSSHLTYPSVLYSTTSVLAADWESPPPLMTTLPSPTSVKQDSLNQNCTFYASNTFFCYKGIVNCMNEWDLLWIILQCEAVVTCLHVISEYLSWPPGPVTSHHPDSSPAPPAGVTIPTVHQSIIVTDPSLVSEKMTGELSAQSCILHTPDLQSDCGHSWPGWDLEWNSWDCLHQRWEPQLKQF